MERPDDELLRIASLYELKWEEVLGMVLEQSELEIRNFLGSLISFREELPLEIGLKSAGLKGNDLQYLLKRADQRFQKARRPSLKIIR